MTSLDRDTAAADALLTDHYLDALLAGVLVSGAGGGDAPGGDPGDGSAVPLDPAARFAANRLRRDLIRVHPSFRFEERLAARLAEAAISMGLPAAVGAEGRVVHLPIPALGANPTNADSSDRTPDRDRARPLLIGGALTSAALSLAGAALVAWRRGHSARSATPMVRAARAARAGRSAAGGRRAAGGTTRLGQRATPRRLD